MGLALPMQRALKILTVNDLAMPDDSQFKVVSATALPDGLTEKSWGPTNDGICAAALIPKIVRHGGSCEIVHSQCQPERHPIGCQRTVRLRLCGSCR